MIKVLKQSVSIYVCLYINMMNSHTLVFHLSELADKQGPSPFPVGGASFTNWHLATIIHRTAVNNQSENQVQKPQMLNICLYML